MTGTATTHAFVVGCSRSGTTALAELLNCHPDVVMGVERYAKLSQAGSLSPDLFTPERFADVRNEDTHRYSRKLYSNRQADFDKLATAKVIGDKVPELAMSLDQLAAFDRPKIIYALRDPFSVAQSFDRRAENPNDNWKTERDHGAAVQQFNQSVSALMDELNAKRFDIHVVRYETLFGAQSGVEALFAFLGVDPARLGPTDAIDQRSARLRVDGKFNALGHTVAMKVNFANYRKAVRTAQGGRLAAFAADQNVYEVSQ